MTLAEFLNRLQDFQGPQKTLEELIKQNTALILEIIVPLEYLQETKNWPEQSYCVTRKELLAVISALKHFHSYLYGQIRTNNGAVSWMEILKKPTGQTVRWLQELGTYALNAIHRPALKHTNAHALSRVPCTSCLNQHTQNDVQNIDEDSKETAIPQCTPLNQIRAVTRYRQVNSSAELMKIKDLMTDGWDQTTLRKSQLDDHEISAILMKVKDKKRPEWNKISNQTLETMGSTGNTSRSSACSGSG
ncbi:unnamed protein product [Mytilus coruscus]|uniref:Reverse transcriptase RNase H-like domain-containing protein n=1 Tax=Mytilus coruscus TaxID=42192 RepID=A0A6J8CZ25_MYTCO|nr:unnamed protein product [Mytilus coruscus]